MGFELTDEQQQDLSDVVRIQGVDWDWDADSIVWAGTSTAATRAAPSGSGRCPRCRT
jgi:hypothetical protein